MRRSGQVTVFLSMVLLCICALLCSIVESARMAGMRCYMQTAADSALDSVFGGYHRQLWDSYRLLLREYGSETDLEEEFSRYFKTYFEQGGWYPAQIEEIKVKQMDVITDEAGCYLENEILDYMKFGIWTMDFSPGETGNLEEKLKEAQAVGRTAEIYSGHTKEAIRVEEALENLNNCLERQKKKKGEGIAALNACDGGRFQRAAGELIQELDKVPGLVKKYEKRADELNEKLEQSRQRFTDEMSDLGEEALKLLEQEIGQYESYISEDGERRKEVVEEIKIAQENRSLTEEVMKEAEEVEEYIENWEGEDEEDELDEEALWRPVREHFKGFQEGRVNCPHGVQDKEKKNTLEKLKQMMEGSLLTLVVPEGKQVSEKKISSEGLPSVLYGGKTSGDSEASLADRLLINEYCGKFFYDFLQEEERPVQYELEYLAAGEMSDKANLSETVRNIFLMREGLNLLHILSDGVKREEARNLAAVLVGASGLAPLVLLVTFLIMNLWAAAEAIYDLRELLSGGKVPLWKSEGDWKLSLENMLNLGRTGKPEGSSGEQADKGLSYVSYIKLILFIEKRETLNYRIMDMIQVNIKARQPDFSMDSCAYFLDIEAKARGKHIFFLPGLVENPYGNSTYPMSARVEKAY
ncbi:DUF5702 domain-containing protein [Lachnospiraceae bacterium 62-35]